MKTLTTLTIREKQDLARTNEKVTVGVPFPVGACDSPGQIRLRHPSAGMLAIQQKLTGRWRATKANDQDQWKH